MSIGGNAKVDPYRKRGINRLIAIAKLLQGKITSKRIPEERVTSLHCCSRTFDQFVAAESRG